MLEVREEDEKRLGAEKRERGVGVEAYDKEVNVAC